MPPPRATATPKRGEWSYPFYGDPKSIGKNLFEVSYPQPPVPKRELMKILYDSGKFSEIHLLESGELRLTRVDKENDDSEGELDKVKEELIATTSGFLEQGVEEYSQPLQTIWNYHYGHDAASITLNLVTKSNNQLSPEINHKITSFIGGSLHQNTPQALRAGSSIIVDIILAVRVLKEDMQSLCHKNFIIRSQSPCRVYFALQKVMVKLSSLYKACKFTVWYFSPEIYRFDFPGFCSVQSQWRRAYEKETPIENWKEEKEVTSFTLSHHLHTDLISTLSVDLCEEDFKEAIKNIREDAQELLLLTYKLVKAFQTLSQFNESYSHDPYRYVFQLGLISKPEDSFHKINHVACRFRTPIVKTDLIEAKEEEHYLGYTIFPEVANDYSPNNILEPGESNLISLRKFYEKPWTADDDYRSNEKPIASFRPDLLDPPEDLHPLFHHFRIKGKEYINTKKPLRELSMIATCEYPYDKDSNPTTSALRTWGASWDHFIAYELDEKSQHGDWHTTSDTYTGTLYCKREGKKTEEERFLREEATQKYANKCDSWFPNFPLFQEWSKDKY